MRASYKNRCVFFILAALMIFNVSLFANKSQNKIIYVAPGYAGDIFAVDNPIYNRDNCLEPFTMLRSELERKGYELRQTHTLTALDDFEYLIVFDIFPEQIHLYAQYPKEKLILLLWEPPSVLINSYNPAYHQYFSKIYTWNDDLVDNKKYFKLYHPALNQMIEDRPSFDEKKLCTLICCNKRSPHPQELYTERLNLITFFETCHAQDFDLYGKWWPDTCKVYKGEVDRKVDYLKLYKFAFAYENVKGVPGYVTEKIFDCFHAGCVPVYLGAPNVDQYIPKNCYISREDFESDETLYQFLKNMNASDYQQYLGNIQSFLKSSEAKIHSREHFVATIMSNVFTESTMEQASLYAQIKDLNHPTHDDYRLIQQYLATGRRDDISALKDYNYEYVSRTFKIIGDEKDALPLYESIPVNCPDSDRENCVLIYASFNRNYPKGLQRLANCIRESDFKGHVLFRVGGWPDTEGGSLRLAHVPYAFKPCFFKEAQRLGYKRVLWLDTSIIPLVSLNDIFKMIEEKGCFVIGNTHMVGPYINESAAQYFGMSRDDTYKIPSCSSGIFGIDFTNEKGAKIIDQWYKAAESKDAFFSPRPDQTALSVILYQAGITDFTSIEKLPHGREEIKPDSLLLLDRLYVHYAQ